MTRSERGYDDLVWYSSNKDLKTDFLEHTTAINDFRVAVAVSARGKGLELITWASESQLKSDYDPVRTANSQRPFALIPDGYFSLSTPFGKAHFFVEVDRGTETLERFKQKIRAYIAYYESGGYERRYGTKSLRVLTVATGTRRLDNLLDAAKEVTSKVGGRRRFWFAQAGELTPHTVLTEPVWYVAGDDMPLVLISPP